MVRVVSSWSSWASPKRTDPVPLSSGLDAVVRSLKAHDAATVRNVFSGWNDAVGAQIAAHARPVKLDGTVLLVEVDEPGWATQLKYLQTELLERLQGLGGGPIDRLEIKVRGAKDRSARSVRNRAEKPRIPPD